MTDRKFYKTTYVVEVLHETTIPDDWDLITVLGEAQDGMYSGDVKSQETEQIDGATCARLLEGQRSDTGFFRLDAEGNDINEEDEE